MTSSSTSTATPVLSVQGLTTEVRGPGGWFPVVRSADLRLDRGETLAVAGESGSGKSMLALSILGLLPASGVRIASGRVELNGLDLLAEPAARVRAMLGRTMSAVFQDPMTSLNPVFTVGDQIVEVIRRHSSMGRRSALDRAAELLDAVRIDNAPKRVRAYPHELSGGQRQRVAMAIAVANEPDLLIADEPTTALDVSVQAEIIDLLDELQERIGMSMLFITHDLGVAQDISDRVAVMYAARIIELADSSELFANPLHPYTRRLMECAPTLGKRSRLAPIPGVPPPLQSLPAGCAFAERCDIADHACRTGTIPLTDLADRHVACIRPGERP